MMVRKRALMGASLVVALTTAALVPVAYAEPEMSDGGSTQEVPPEMPGGGGMPGEDGGASVSYSGVLSITEDLTSDGESYASSGDAENAILMSAGTVKLTNPTITKTGAADGDNADFYGTNAAVLVSGGTLTIEGGTLTTDGAHANGAFAYGEGIINISDTVIKTTSNNSGAVMVTGGGTLTATNVTATTEGNSSAPIRSDRGGGKMEIEGGTYTSNGVGSPVIYSTADIVVKNATLTSTASEGVVIEGKNSVSLEGVKLVADNNQLNGQSETYKNIFIYQSMSGDADEGVGSFAAKDSEITTKNGDIFFITNTTAEIELSHNIFTGVPAGFLRVQTGSWGNSGANGGEVVLTATEQEMVGDIFVDEISSLSLTMKDDSYYKGTINGDNTAEEIDLNLSSDSVIVLTGDSYVSSLNNADTENKNIYGDGHKLYVAGVEAATNTETPPTGRKNPTVLTEAQENPVEAESTEVVDDYSELGFILAAAGSLLVLIVGGILIARSMKKGGGSEKDAGDHIESASDVEINDDGGQMEGPDAR